jgi:hypothetical protein
MSFNSPHITTGTTLNKITKLILQIAKQSILSALVAPWAVENPLPGTPV